MPWLIPILTKLALWALPRLAGSLVDRIQQVLTLVESAEHMADVADRRNWVLQELTRGQVPEWLARVEVEVGVMLFRLGITAESLNTLETLVADQEVYCLVGATKRNAVLEEFLKLCPTVSENAARLLIQVVVAKVKAQPPGRDAGTLPTAKKIPPIPPHNCDGEPTAGVPPLCCGKCYGTEPKTWSSTGGTV